MIRAADDFDFINARLEQLAIERQRALNTPPGMAPIPWTPMDYARRCDGQSAIVDQIRAVIDGPLVCASHRRPLLCPAQLQHRDLLDATDGALHDFDFFAR
jgi:hypothetical protein